MTYIAVNNPPSDIAATTFASGYGLNQQAGYFTGTNSFATASINLDFSVISTTTIFTTEANRGRFFPISVAISCQAVYSGSPGASNPAFSIGFNAPNYQEFIKTQSLTKAQTTTITFGSGQYEIFVPQTINALGSTGTSHISSAPASTDIKIILTAVNTGVVSDLRTVSIFGFYTG